MPAAYAGMHPHPMAAYGAYPAGPSAAAAHHMPAPVPLSPTAGGQVRLRVGVGGVGGGRVCVAGVR